MKSKIQRIQTNLRRAICHTIDHKNENFKFLALSNTEVFSVFVKQKQIGQVSGLWHNRACIRKMLLQNPNLWVGSPHILFFSFYGAGFFLHNNIYETVPIYRRNHPSQLFHQKHSQLKFPSWRFDAHRINKFGQWISTLPAC